MSVGRTAELAARGAPGRSPSTSVTAAGPRRRDRSPARSGVTRTATNRARARRAAVASACPSPTSSASAPAGGEHARPRRATTASTAPSALSAACGSQSRTSGSSAGRSGGVDVRRVGDDRSHGPAGKPSKRSWRSSSTARPVRARVLGGERERLGGAVDAGDVGARVLVGDRERDRARSRADVEHARLLDCPRSARARARRGSPSRAAGSSARGSTVSVSRRKPHSPRTYWSGSRRPAARRARARASSSAWRQRPVERHVELDPLEAGRPVRAGARRRAAASPSPCAARCSVERRSTSPRRGARRSSAGGLEREPPDPPPGSPP